jgi:hypothetical protein
LKDIVATAVMKLDDPAVMWDRFKSLFAPKSNTRKMMLKQQLYNMRLDKNMEQNLRLVDSILVQLAGLGESIPDEDLVTLTLGALPKSWRVFRRMISGREMLPSYADLEGLLLQEEIQ